MKAMVCERFGGPEVLALHDVPDPPPPGPGEIQVRIAARGVQYVDVLMLAGKYQFRPEPPFIPGMRAGARAWRGGPGGLGSKPGAPALGPRGPGAFSGLGNCKGGGWGLIPPPPGPGEGA